MEKIVKGWLKLPLGRQIKYGEHCENGNPPYILKLSLTIIFAVMTIAASCVFYFGILPSA
jgi:hypothetical protein